MASYELTNTKWGNATLGTGGGQVKWSFANTTGQFYGFDYQISDPTFQRLVREAFDAWEAVANIDFVEVVDSAASQIRLGWDYIDGAFGTVGEATWNYYDGVIDQFAQAEIRFDTAENWTNGYVDIPNAVNFFAVAQHEIGHALGLDHTDDFNTIMYAYQNPQVQLAPGDIAGARAIYGAQPQASGIRYTGTNGNDTHFGLEVAEEMYGLGGSDYLVGLGGDDFIDGGAGLDFAGYYGNVDDYAIYKRANGQLEVRDINNLYNEGWDDLVNIERLDFADGVLAWDLDGNAGKAFRLYQAAFDRLPDVEGLGYWIRELDAGKGDLAYMAFNFIISNEFRATYGSPQTVSDAQFINLLYQNVLNRGPDQAGLNYWLDRLEDGFSRERTLASFAESTENIANTAGAIQDGIWYV